MQLFRTTCHNDWKGRPSHKIALIATSDDRSWLIQAMNEDVAKWQASDLTSLQNEWDADIDVELDDEELEARGERPTKWEDENLRWEMERLSGNNMREFVNKVGDDGFLTTVYHLMQVSTLH